MKIIDISVPLFSGMVYYPGDSGAKIEAGKQISRGDSSNLSEIEMGSHTGTHVDAPHHFIDGLGKVDNIALETLIGPVRVLDLTRKEGHITGADLESAGCGGALRVLLKTRNSKMWSLNEFDRGFIALADDGADYVIKKGIKLIGNDYLSIEKFNSDTHYVHKTLLTAGVVILEGVDLSGVAPGDYELACLPLLVKGGDGAPARAVLIER